MAELDSIERPTVDLDASTSALANVSALLGGIDAVAKGGEIGDLCDVASQLLTDGWASVNALGVAVRRGETPTADAVRAALVPLGRTRSLLAAIGALDEHGADVVTLGRLATRELASVLDALDAIPTA